MGQASLSEKRALLAKLLQRKDYSFPLSHGQQALWFIHQNAPDSSAYNMAWSVELQGDLNLTALQQALQALVNRHSALRTIIEVVNGEPLQMVQPTGTYAFRCHETVGYSEQQLAAVIKTAYGKPFDLTRDTVLRVDILQAAPQLCILILTMHHIFGDTSSMNTLGRESLTLYEAELSGEKAVLPTLPSSYADFVRSETAMLNSSVGEELLQYWKRRLDGESPILKLPTDYPRPAAQSYNGSSVKFHLSAKLDQQVKQLAREKSVTLFTLLLTAFQILLHRYTGQTEIWIGSPTATARRDPQFSNIVGYLANTAILRTEINDPNNLSFQGILSENRKTVFEAIEHSVYPFILLIKTIQPKRYSSYSPLFQVMINFQEPDLLPETIGDLTVSPFDFSQMEGQFDLRLQIIDNEQLGYRLYYNTDLFGVETIERMVGHFQVLLAAIVENVDCPIAQLPLLTEKEIQQIHTWRDKETDFPDGLKEAIITDLFDKQAKKKPGPPGVNPDRNTPVYILDPNYQLLPVGVPGELYIGGAQLGHDGLNNPEPAGDKFVEVELFGKIERLFQTGHFAKWSSDGKVEPLNKNAPSEPIIRNKRYIYPRDEVEFQLVKIWEDLFDISPVSVIDDFFEIGGDSLLGIRLMLSIQKNFGISLQLRSLFQNKTPEKLACIIRDDYSPPPWSPLVCLQSQGTKTPLFFVHASGGSAFDFIEIAMHMGTERPFYAIQPKGIEMGDAFHDTVEEMAADYVTATRNVQKKGPYLLGGWSFGATVAFEMARILEQAGETILLLIMIDTPSPCADVCKEDDFDFLMDRIPYYYGVNLEDLDLQDSTEKKVSYLLQEVKLTGVFTPDIDPAYAHHWLNMYKHHNLMVRAYNPPAPINGKIVFFKPSEKIPFDDQMGNPSLAWQPFTRGEFDIEDGPGNHFSMISPTNTPRLVAQLKEYLKERFDD